MNRPAAARWSLRTRLVLLLAGASLLTWTLGSAWLYRRALAESDALFDAALVETAHAVLALVAVERKDRFENGERGEHENEVEIELPPIDHRHSERLFYQVRDARGVVHYRSPGTPAVALAAAGASGFSDQSIDGAGWRVFSLAAGPAARMLQIDVGQRVANRRSVARGGALRLLLPGVVLALVLAMGTWLIVRRVTAPIVGFSRAIDQQAPTTTRPVATSGLPSELAPIALAVNRLLARVEAALQQERTLTADAAHELRTPLAALRAQAQVALRSTDTGERDAALRALLGGVDRAARAVDSVLALARLDALDPAHLAAVELPRLVQIVLEDLGPQAAQRGLIVQASIASDTATALGDAEALAVLVRNLVENAIRHAARRVLVEAARRGERIALAVRDDGQGMSEEQARRAFDRFYRAGNGGGSGLGLALVRRIAELHGGRAGFVPGLDGRGVGVEVDLPAARREVGP